MNCQQKRPPTVSIVPGGYSDSDNDDSDGSGNYFHEAALAAATPRNRTVYSGQVTSSKIGGEGTDATPGSSETQRIVSWRGGEFWGRSQSEAIRLACLRGNLDKLKQLLSNTTACPEVNELFAKSQETPLIVCCANGHPQLVEYLLGEKSVDPNKRHASAKLTALMAVAGSCSEADEELLLKCAEHLMAKNANINLQEQFGMTALMIAVKRGRSLLAKYFIEKGANVNIQEADQGFTALFFAAINGDGRMCRLLLEFNADIQIVSKSGFSAVEIAQEKEFRRIADLLHIVRTTRWRPGLKPSLMTQLDEEAFKKRQDAIRNNSTVKPQSSIDNVLEVIAATKYSVNFRKNSISYVQFLTMDDTQLKEIGIQEVGIRMKILDHIKHIHNAPWLPSSLPRIAPNVNVSSAEALCMILNIKEHLHHISGTVRYLCKRITNKPVDLKFDIERNKIQQIVELSNDSMKDCSQVGEDLTQLSSIIGKIQGYQEFQIKGQIPKRKFGNDEKKKFKLLNCGIGLTMGVGFLVLGLLKW